MKFNDNVVRQADVNVISFGNSYIAYPVKKAVLFDDFDVYWSLREKTITRIEFCRSNGIGILQVLPYGNIFYALENKYKEPWRVFDFSQYNEDENDEAGLPYQKGVSAGYMELKAIKEYVKDNPDADWKDIFKNVQNHYSSPQSLAGSMKQWRGFSLKDYKKEICK